jgi:hypothetical protein
MKNWRHEKKRYQQSQRGDGRSVQGERKEGVLPSLSMTDLMRTFWEKGTCMIICKQGGMMSPAGSSWFVLT